jgi:hypothetical protein
MRTRTVALLGLVLSLAVAPAVALGVSASNSQTYADSTGEDPSAVDISSVAVSNDDAGLLTFQVNVTNRPALTGDLLYQVYLDTAPNVGDPDSLGADYVIQLTPAGVALFRWNGSEFPFAESQAGVSYAYATAGPSLRVSAAALGTPRTLNFFAFAVSGVTVDANGDPDYTNARADLAPNFGLYTGYEVRTTLVLSVVRSTTSPRPARAGGPFSAALAVTRNDTGGPITAGSVTCTARIGGAVLRVRGRRVTNGIAACSWTLPRTAAGQVVRGTIAVTVDGTRVTRTFSARVQPA